MQKERSFRYAATVVMFAKYSVVFINLVVNAVLARLISPEEFGIVAITSVFVNLFTIFSDIGVGAAIIQNENLSEEDISSIFFYSICFGLALGTIFFVSSFAVAYFYGNMLYIVLFGILAIALFCGTINTVPNALIMKKKRFASVSIRTVISGLISGGVSILVAIEGYGVYALVLLSVINNVVIFGWNYISEPVIIRKGVNRKSLDKIKSYSLYLFGFNFLNYFARNLDNLLIGKILGNALLGYYDKAYKLMLYPVQNLTYVINPVIHPFLAVHQNNKSFVYNKYMQILKILSWIGIFVTVFCFYFSKTIVYIVYGKGWEYSIPIFRCLSISLWFQLTTSSTGAIYQSINKTKEMMHSGILYIPIQLILLFVGLLKGDLVFIATMVSAGFIVKFFVDYYILLKKGFHISYVKFLGNFIPELLIMCGCMGSMRLFDYFFQGEGIKCFFLRFLVLMTSYGILFLLTKQHKLMKSKIN